MERYAAHYLYGPVGEYCKQGVVELEDGIVSSFFPLREEVHSVSWLGGVIILSGRKDYRWNGSFSLPEIVSHLVEGISKDAPLYAYHINRIDFRKEKLLPDATVCRL